MAATGPSQNGSAIIPSSLPANQSFCAAPFPCPTLVRLDRIKLAGFKSFVDPTTIPTPGNLIGIVGPNGCGKSNIIDAVRWVMGESSAKHLRGEHMADVIFNGSSTRKPVGYAAVELIFDNSEGKAPGEFARYQEIAIKRQVTRDGQSTYSLNGTRCRRRDITDLFLGTGLGARSYAIIEQGTISRLIEAKPQELKELIEEAAGISRYRERRHETELRMGHTQENLSRLLDLREEVSKQVENLKRQTQKAERHNRLKEQERTLKAQLLGLRWRTHQAAFDTLSAEVQDTERQCTEVDEQLSAGSLQTADTQSRHDTLQTTLHDTQGRLYGLSSDISRITQSLRHAAETKEALRLEVQRLEESRESVAVDLAQDERTLAEIRAVLAALEAERLTLTAEETKTATERERANGALRALEQTQAKLSNTLISQKTQREIKESLLQQLLQQQQTVSVRQDKLDSLQQAIEREIAAIDLDGLVLDIEQHRNAHAADLAEQKALKAQLSELRDEIHAARKALQSRLAEHHGLEGQVASLTALQSEAMGTDQSQLADWLTNHQLRDCPRLAEDLQVEPSWEKATENLLGPWLKALCLSSDDRLDSIAKDLPDADLALIVRQENPSTMPIGCLGEKIAGEYVRSLPRVARVHWVNNLDEALRRRSGLGPEDTLLTPDGTEVGPNFLMQHRPAKGPSGLLQRARELKALKDRLASEQIALREAETRLSVLEERLHHSETQKEGLDLKERQAASTLAALLADHSAREAQLRQHQSRLKQLETDRGEARQEQESLDQRRTQTMETLQQLARDVPLLEAEADQQQAVKGTAAEQFAELSERLRGLREALRALEAKKSEQRASETLTQRHIERLQTQLAQTTQGLKDLGRKTAEIESADPEGPSTLAALHEERAVVEKALHQQRSEADRLAQAIREALEHKSRLEQQQQKLRQTLEQRRLALTTHAVHRDTLQQQLLEIGVEPGHFAHSPESNTETDEKTIQKELESVQQDLGRLGAVNLSAIEEYPEQQERLGFLEQQALDLRQSLEALKEAIDTIDEECRSRFKATFDLLNSGLGRMFPKLFGGGEASLALTERALLDAGVTIMARPPGKRNSSIHLLSGGEKALTAAALVFAIFELNPAPFCLLDEVDAPLDEANVGRFSQLVKEMSETVQFLFISHNKATMEMASHLAGVTMKEPGVSRIVAVDLDAAVEMTTA